MTPHGPRFLDEDLQPLAPSAPPAEAVESVVAPDLTSLPRGPTLLDPEPDAPERLELSWIPEAVTVPRRRIGTAFWIGAGLCTIVVSWLVLSAISFVLMLSRQSLGLGGLASIAIFAGLAMVLYAVLLEVRAYRSLGNVERLRAILAARETTMGVARGEARIWLQQVGAGLRDAAATDRMLQGAETVAEIRGILRSQVADQLRERAKSLGRRAAVEGATLVAICPHPAWDGMIAGGRGLLVVRQVAALYGLRPGLAVTLALVRRVAWTAAGTTGVSLVSQGLASHILTNLPVIKHVADAIPGTSLVAARLYSLAGVTAETCSPVSRS